MAQRSESRDRDNEKESGGGGGEHEYYVVSNGSWSERSIITK